MSNSTCDMNVHGVDESIIRLLCLTGMFKFHAAHGIQWAIHSSNGFKITVFPDGNTMPEPKPFKIHELREMLDVLRPDDDDAE